MTTLRHPAPLRRCPAPEASGSTRPARSVRLRPFLVCLALGLPFVGGAQEEPIIPRTAALRDSFRYQPMDAANPVAVHAAEDDVVELEAFTVTESIMRRHLAQTLQQSERRRRDEQFTWRSGGRWRSYPRGAALMELGAWPELFSRELAHTGIDHGVRVSLVNVRW